MKILMMALVAFGLFSSFSANACTPQDKCYHTHSWPTGSTYCCSSFPHDGYKGCWNDRTMDDEHRSTAEFFSGASVFDELDTANHVHE